MSLWCQPQRFCKKILAKKCTKKQCACVRNDSLSLYEGSSQILDSSTSTSRKKENNFSKYLASAVFKYFRHITEYFRHVSHVSFLSAVVMLLHWHLSRNRVAPSCCELSRFSSSFSPNLFLLIFTLAFCSTVSYGIFKSRDHEYASLLFFLIEDLMCLRSHSFQRWFRNLIQ